VAIRSNRLAPAEVHCIEHRLVLSDKRSCWKSKPLLVLTKDSTWRMPRKRTAKARSCCSIPGMRGTANSGVSPLNAQISLHASARPDR
jgi:hypothetical protein